MIVLGIVGTPAGGKSTVAKFLASLGAEWIDADAIAKACLDEPDVVETLVGHFGDSIRADDGSIERARVADLVFGTDREKQENLRFLESVVHPRTRRRILDRISVVSRANAPVVLLDVPLLFESGWDRACDAIWCVDASPEIRLQRSMVRGWDTSELARREANQLPIDAKSRLSNLVMRNDATLESLHEKLRRQWGHLVRIDTEAQANPISQRRRHCISDRVVNS